MILGGLVTSTLLNLFLLPPLYLLIAQPSSVPPTAEQPAELV